MAARPEPPPLSRLIARKRKAMSPELSMRQAARRAGFSPALWAKIEHGYDQVAPGVVIPYAGTADKVARMARVLGITPQELAGAGRRDAAAELEAMPPQPPQDGGEGLAEIRDRQDELERVLDEMRRELRELREPGRPAG